MQEKKFQLQLKNDQSIELKFTSIEQTNDQLWQMFATNEALAVLQSLVDANDPEQTRSARKTPPKKEK
jgi:hypothetical protein